MNPGARNAKIEIQKVFHTKDEIGNQEKDWKRHCAPWAYVNNLSGSEYWEAARLNNKANVIFSVRYSKAIGEVNPGAYRIVWGGKVYNITYIDNVQYKNQAVKIHAAKEE